MEERAQRTSSVVDLDSYRSGDVAEGAIERIEQYWTDIKGDRLVPSRSELRPADLQSVLDRLFILERVARGQARFRVVGSTIVDRIGHDLRGMPLSALMEPRERGILKELLTSVMEEPATVRLTLDGGPGQVHGRVSGALTLLPLRSDLGDVTRIVGAMDLDGTPADPNQRLSIIDTTHRTLIGYADGGARPGGRTVVTRASAPATPVVRGHLRLVSQRD